VVPRSRPFRSRRSPLTPALFDSSNTGWHMNICRNEAESQRTCRGTIPVADAAVQEHGMRSFVVSCNRRAYYLRALTTADRDRWVRTIRVTISQARATKLCSACKHFSQSSSSSSSETFIMHRCITGYKSKRFFKVDRLLTPTSTSCFYDNCSFIIPACILKGPIDLFLTFYSLFYLLLQFGLS